MPNPQKEIRGWQVLNPAIYLISVLPGALVFILRGGSLSHPVPFFLAVGGVCFVQHAINVLNDYTDWRRGADVEKYDSWVRVQRGNLRRVRIHGLTSLALGLLLGTIGLQLVGKFWLLGVALPFVALGYFYNAGEKPLSYTPYAEWATGLCYGPGVFGCLWLVENSDLSWSAFAGAMAFAALATAILFAHQPPQVLTDSLAGKLSFAVRFGAERARGAARLLQILFFVAALAALFLAPLPPTIKLASSLAGLFFIFRSLRQRVSPRTVLAGTSYWIGFLIVLQSLSRSFL